MQVLNNASAFQVWKSYTQNVTNMRQSMSKLSSGLKIQTAADDPAGLAISERLRAQYRNSAQAAVNIENDIAYMQTADSWLQKVHDILGRMAELAVAANDGTKSTGDRANLNTEYKQMQSEIRRIVQGDNAAGKYGGTHLFTGAQISVQVGPDSGQLFEGSAIDLQTTVGTSQWATMFNYSIATQSAANNAVATVNKAIDFISSKRAVLGAEQSRLTHTLEGLRNYEDNIRASESRIRDVDVAKETTEFSKLSILTQVGTAMLAQANAMPQGVIQLLG
jgi:flagellin